MTGTLGTLVDRGLVAADWSEALAPVEATIEAMGRFLAAGGQTREGEAAGIAPLLDAMLGPVGPPDPDLTGH